MAPISQTLYSVTLFLALSSLLAWSHRRHRGARQLAVQAVVSPARCQESARVR